MAGSTQRVPHSIFIRSFKPDMKWLEWCLRFLRKNWRTNSDIVISAPFDCIDAIKSFQDILGRHIRHQVVEQWPDNNAPHPNRGYNHQQYCKMMADEICYGDMITFIDSDTMMFYPCGIEDLCENGKPIIWYCEYSKVNYLWQDTVYNVMRSLYPEYEYMRKFPITLRWETLLNCRNYIRRIHGKDIADLLYERPAYTWSEFNLLGFFADVFERDSYVFKHTDLLENDVEKFHNPARQFHSKYEFTHETIAYLTQMLGGIPDESPLDDAGRIIKTPKKSQTSLIEKVAHHAKPGSVAIDVGAHEGMHAFSYASRGAEVFAFEPNPESFSILCRKMYSLGQGPFSHHCFPYAAGDRTGSCTFLMDPRCTEASWVQTEQAPEPDPLQSPKEITVDMIRLDDLLAVDHVTDKGVSLLKIDVEGLEPLVLKGARDLISKFRPVIVVECQKLALERNGFTRQDVLKHLDGYDLEISVDDPRASTDDADFFYDIIATPKI